VAALRPPDGSSPGSISRTEASKASPNSPNASPPDATSPASTETTECRPRRSTPGIQLSRRRGRPISHQSVSGSPSSRSHSSLKAARSQAPPPEPRNDQSSRAERL
jgi:hypothetical protein